MISFEESRNVIELKKYFLVLQNGNIQQKRYYERNFKGKFLNKQFSYSSDKNDKFLSQVELKKLIKKNFLINKKY